MTKGRQSDQWGHTADLIAYMHRIWIGGSWSSADFHPYAMTEPVQQESNFDARLYAIQLVGSKAVEVFEQAARERQQCQQGRSKLGA